MVPCRRNRAAGVPISPTGGGRSTARFDRAAVATLRRP
ncbi:hypothetical protein NJ7G_4114 [Natrinema sp. J7-2]|nr:hypothetical protein NJ7G_4114 [Natrinema sp. J7-2]